MDLEEKRSQILGSMVEGQYAITKQHIYQITIKTLTMFFDNNVPMETRLEKLNQHGGAHGVLKATGSDERTGIMGDERDIKRRQSFFGPNKKPKPQLPPFWESFKDAIDDKIILTAAVFAVLTMLTGLIYDPSGMVDGIAILISLLLLVLITSCNDWKKDTKFVELQQLGAQETITTIRGKNGNTETTSVWKLVVGDVIYLKAGDNIPADCIILSSNNLVCDETYHEGHEAEVHKGEADPFLFAEANILSGNCKAFVCAVGDASSRGELAQKHKTSGDTPLETKLQSLSKTFTFIGIMASLIILITSIIILIIQASASDDLGGTAFMVKLVDCFTLSLILIMVAIPEGLALTVGVSLAYSVMKMYYKDKILVQDLEKPEVLGQIEEIITGKTGTMTTEDMKVEKFYAQSVMIENSRANTLVHCTQVSEDVKMRLKENITYNTGARIEMSEDAQYVPVGQGTDTSLLRFLQDAEFPVHYNVRDRPNVMLYEIPFSSANKRQVTAIKHPEIEETVRIYVKGAPEIVVPNCNSYFDSEGNKVPMDQSHGEMILTDIYVNEMARKGLRGIAFAFRDVHIDDWQAIQQQIDPTNDQQNLNLLEQDLTFSAVVGLRDPLRNRVEKVIKFCEKGDLIVRIVSGDNVETVKQAAIEAKLISAEEADMENVCMDATEFRTMIGGIREVGENTFEPGNQEVFDQIVNSENRNALRVLGRASAEDKLLLAAAIKGQGKKIGLVGEGLNDVKAFKFADISFSMGTGVALAKESSSMVLVTDEFESSIRGVMWGRNIYNNIRRFLQFQITINFSVLVITLIGICALTEAPLNPTMLLYINLIMDMLGALALTTQPPEASIIRQKPVNNEEVIMQKVIWRQIYALSIWNILVMCLIIFFGEPMFDLNYSASTMTQDYKDTYSTSYGLTVPTVDGLMAIDKLKHLTIIFNTFVFLCFFNLINCRTVGAKDFNVFSHFFNNWMFIFILALIFVMQVVWCNYVTFLFNTYEISAKDFWTCVVWGATPLAVSAIVKCTPEHWVEKMPVKIHEDKVLGEDSKMMQLYNEKAKGKVSGARQSTPYDQINESDDNYQNGSYDENRSSQSEN